MDVGTNSVHMIVAEAQRHGYRVIDNEKDMVQLGRDSLEGRPLTDEAIERGVKSLTHMAEIARRLEADDIVAVATSAIREAPNGRKFLGAVKKAAGIDVRVISGEEEADLIWRAVRSAVDFQGGSAFSVDIGGGSVELIVGTEKEVFFTASEPAGALRIAQRFDLDGVATAESVAECRGHLRRLLKKTLARVEALGFDFTIGTSGTIVTLAELAGAGSNGSEMMASGLHWLGRTALRELIDELAPLPAEERARRYSIDRRRADTILAGAIVLHEILRGLGIERLRACDAALREGIVEQMLSARSEDRSDGGGVRRSSVLALAERTAVDRAHAEQVARLALRIFDQTEPLHMLRTGERELLEYAALLHDAGMHVAYDSHHKHAYYLISHAGLRGFTGDQVATVANVARYHRKGAPKEEHQNFADLSPAQQEVVTKLSAILRIAEGLDRGRRGVVRDIGVTVSDERVAFHVRPRGEAAVELEAARKKSNHFRKVFERGVEFDLRSG